MKIGWYRFQFFLYILIEQKSTESIFFPTNQNHPDPDRFAFLDLNYRDT
ncbi:hypothetical protein LCGC14_1665770 [marine sediment metagenome]|uniref:Uncharacterized protein n=1 Tax=marine sediment metagenome TaxID=412755 RepID=A0A0F9KSM7_9ZZZZ